MAAAFYMASKITYSFMKADQKARLHQRETKWKTKAEVNLMVKWASGILVRKKSFVPPLEIFVQVPIAFTIILIYPNSRI